jgi:hypothetical protein
VKSINKDTLMAVIFGIRKVLNVLPEAAETVATFTPLAPFSKLIDKGIKGIVDVIAKKRKLQ